MGNKEAEQLVTTPSKKRKVFAASAEKSKQKRTDDRAIDFQVGDVVEVQEKVHSCNHADRAELLERQRGVVKDIDEEGDVQIHFYDHTNACQWVAKGSLRNLKLLPTPPLPLKAPSAGRLAVEGAVGAPKPQQAPASKPTITSV